MTRLTRTIVAVALTIMAIGGCSIRHTDSRVDITTGRQVSPAVVVTGLVLDADTRRPLAGALALLIKKGVGEVSLDERTDASGRFVTPGKAIVRQVRPTTLTIRRFAQRRIQDSDHPEGVTENYLTHVPEEMPLPSQGHVLDVGTILLLPGDMTNRIDLVPRGSEDDGPWRKHADFSNPGLDFSWGKPVVTVRVVVTGSPADGAGIRVGDSILSVDGRDVTGLGPGAVRYLAGGKVGTTVELVIKSSEGTRRTLHLERFKG